MKPALLVALLCDWNADTGRFDAGCVDYTRGFASHVECQVARAELIGSTPAGVRVVAHDCDDITKSARARLIAARPPSSKGQP